MLRNVNNGKVVIANQHDVTLFNNTQPPEEEKQQEMVIVQSSRPQVQVIEVDVSDDIRNNAVTFDSKRKIKIDGN